MSYTPYNAPLLGGLLGDRELSAVFSVANDLQAYRDFEIALVRAQCALGIIPETVASALIKTFSKFEPDMRAISEQCAIDGVTVPEFVRQLKGLVTSEDAEFVHYGATSQDLIDTSLTLRLKSINPILTKRLSDIGTQLKKLDQQYGDLQIAGRTRMQKALPVKVSDRITNWAKPLLSCTAKLEALRSDIEVVQFGGPVGTLHHFDSKGPALRKMLAQELGLHDPECSWHTDRTRIVNYLTCLAQLTSALGKMGQDMALMAQNEMADIRFSASGTSSAMPHKQNPIKPEAMVALARFNAGQMGLIHQSAVHEQERSGSSWTLEWMVLPQIVLASGAALRLALETLSQVESLGLRE